MDALPPLRDIHISKKPKFSNRDLDCWKLNGASLAVLSQQGQDADIRVTHADVRVTRAGAGGLPGRPARMDCGRFRSSCREGASACPRAIKHLVPCVSPSAGQLHLALDGDLALHPATEMLPCHAITSRRFNIFHSFAVSFVIPIDFTLSCMPYGQSMCKSLWMP